MSHKAKSIIQFLCVVTAFMSLSFSLPASASLTLEVGADVPVAKAGSLQRVVVRTLLKPDVSDKGRAGNRAPMAVALVLDKSGSMDSDRKMENAKKGAIEALEYLERRDVATVVVYDDSARMIVTPRSVTKKEAFVSAISKIRANGSTALYDGVELGAEKLQTFVREGFVPRVILLSDGIANIGPSSTEELAALGRRLAGREVTITTIALGLDYNEDLMTSLASQSGGNAYFVKNAKMLPEIFARDMEDATALTARHVQVTLICGANVTPIKVLGRPGTGREKMLSTTIDNVYGSEKYALFELEISPQADRSSLSAATVKVEYTDAATGETFSSETPLKLSFTKNAAEVTKNRQADIVAQAALARNAELREEVVRLADEGRAGEASSLLRSRMKYMKNELSEAVQTAPAASSMVSEDAASLELLAEDLESNGAMSNEVRKGAMNDAYRQKNQQTPVKEQ
jgi:Ca-activated chloride channel family protein